MLSAKVFHLAVTFLFFGPVYGHGRWEDPPSRQSAWRYGFGTPKDYSDMESSWCGGRDALARNGGRCGICGDAADKPKEKEVGGRFFTGKIFRTYQEGATIPSVLDITADHGGWSEFKVCPANGDKQEVAQSCLDQHVLEIEGKGKRYEHPKPGAAAPARKVPLKLKLPKGLKCDRCVMQWTWHSTFTKEQWSFCSDVKIGNGGG